MAKAFTDEDYRALAGFREELRTFLSFSKTAALEAGITAEQHQVLLAIRATSEASMLIGELAASLKLRPQSASGLIDRMEKSGLVRRQRTEADRRRVPVELTADGEALLVGLSRVHQAELRRLRPLLASILSRI